MQCQTNNAVKQQPSLAASSPSRKPAPAGKTANLAADRARFWAKVNKDGPVQKHTPHLGKCWEWTAGKASIGYGKFWDGEKMIQAHWFLIGKPPEGLEACHKCDNPCCVRPSHLFFGTRSDNMRDCRDKERLNPKSTATLLGHVFSGEKNCMAKLSDAEVQAIKAMQIPRGKISATARKMGINAQTFYCIHRGDRRVL